MSGEMYKRISARRQDHSRSFGVQVTKPNQSTMKLIIVAFALVAAVVAIPVDNVPTHEIKILRSDYDQKPEGGYTFVFETENGINRQEEGQVKEVLDEEKKPHIVVVVRGSYSYPKEDGKTEVVNYVADEFGYQAQGDSIPKATSRR